MTAVNTDTDGLYDWKASQVVEDLLWHLTSAYMKCVHRWAGGRTLRHNQIFSDGYFTKFCYPWCSAIIIIIIIIITIIIIEVIIRII